MSMGIPDLVRAYAGLTPKEQAQFAAMVRGHQVFNTLRWKSELARRHAVLEAGESTRVENVAALVAQK